MGSSIRIAVLIVILVGLLAPMAVMADGPCPGSNPCVGTSTTGPCPDDPEGSAECDQETPPYYVVINRNVECANRTGTGCAPFILKHPECKDCRSAECQAIDVEEEVCRAELAGLVAQGQTEVVYEMCCAGADDGSWLFRIRLLDSEGNCPLDPANSEWIEGLPPGTGVNLPAPLMVGGLAVLGAGFVATGLVIRRRSR